MDKLPIPDIVKLWLPFALNIGRATVVLVVGWIASKWVLRLTRRLLSIRKVDQALANFLGAMAQYAVLAATILATLGTVGIETTSFIAIFGAVALAVASALRGSLGHLASGVLILFFRPFDLGHKITAAGSTGVVSDIGLFGTTLLGDNNEVIIIPNGAITAGSIVNYSAKGTLRGRVVVDVAFGADVPRVVEVLRAAAARVEGVLDEPKAAAGFSSIGPRGLEFQVLFFAKVDAFPAVVGAVRHAVYDDLKKAGVEVPLSHVVVAPQAVVA